MKTYQEVAKLYYFMIMNLILLNKQLSNFVGN